MNINKKKIKSKIPIIVGLTTLPDRLKKGITAKSIISILEDENIPEKIILTIPEKTLDGRKYDMRILNEYPYNLDIIEINIVKEDKGPILKIDGLIKYIIIKDYLEISEVQKIILIDDDMIYGKGMILELYNESIKNEKEGIGYAGRVFNGKDLVFIKLKDEKEELEVTFIETYHMVIYPIEVFINNIIQWNIFLEKIYEIEEEAKYTDDIVIGKWCDLMGIRKKIINKHNTKEIKAIENKGEKLSDKNLKGRNMRVFRRLYL